MFDMSALELSQAIKEKKFSVTEVVGGYLDKIEKNSDKFNAFISTCRQEAMSKAIIVQGEIDSGQLTSPLAGVPVGLKDNISTKGVATTCASNMLSGYKPVFDATIVEKLEQAGMIVIGKLNMDEFAMGASSETSFYGAVRNPWDTTRTAGGSSGGSAAAVAAGEVPLTIGSDTGGSIRQPCAFCSVTGIKPTYGSVSRYGLVAFASSLDQMGPVGRDARDCAALLSIISGPDARDSTCIAQKPFEFDAKIPDSVEGLRIGLPSNYFRQGIAPGVKEAVLAAADEYSRLGAQIEEFEMPLVDYMTSVYYIISCAEASSNLAKFDGLKYGYRSEKAASLAEVYRMSRSEGFGLEVKRRIMLGSFVLSSGHFEAFYKKALKARAIISDTYEELFKRFDMLLTPVAPTTAYKIGSNIDDPVKMYIGDIYTVSVNLAGLPAVALPCGFDGDGMPIGFQLVGKAFDDMKLLHAAQVFQKHTDHHTKPALTETEPALGVGREVLP